MEPPLHFRGGRGRKKKSAPKSLSWPNHITTCYSLCMTYPCFWIEVLDLDFFRTYFTDYLYITTGLHEFYRRFGSWTNELFLDWISTLLLLCKQVIAFEWWLWSNSVTRFSNRLRWSIDQIMMHCLEIYYCILLKCTSNLRWEIGFLWQRRPRRWVCDILP